MRRVGFILGLALVAYAGSYPEQFETRYANGQLFTRGTRLNGELHGKWEAWYENGDRLYERHYDKGMPTRRWTTWHEQGQVRESIEYRKGLRDGVSEEFYINGRLKQRWRWRKGKRDRGTMSVYHWNGRLMTRIAWDAEGRRADGTQAAWHEDNTKWYEGRWKNQKRDGTWTWWHQGNGMKSRVVTYKNGVPTGWDIYYDIGGREESRSFWG